MLEAGFSDNEIRQHLRSGRWVCIRRGAYVDHRQWNAMSQHNRHKACIHAVTRNLRGQAVVSHASASVMHDLPLWDIDLSRVHVTRPPGVSTRQEAGVWHHSAALPTDAVVEIDGVPVTGGQRTVIDTARINSFEASVVVADAALRANVATPQDLLQTVDLMRDWPGARNAGRVVEFADGKSESVGESRARVLLSQAQIPRPQLQVTLETGDRVDFLIMEYSTVIEFDGKLKYGRLLGPNDDPGEVAWREKQREDRIRELGYEVVRIIWSDLTRVELVKQRINRAIERAQRRNSRLHAA